MRESLRSYASRNNQHAISRSLLLGRGGSGGLAGRGLARRGGSALGTGGRGGSAFGTRGDRSGASGRSGTCDRSSSRDGGCAFGRRLFLLGLGKLHLSMRYLGQPEDALALVPLLFFGQLFEP